jgi:hypothetical protein
MKLQFGTPAILLGTAFIAVWLGGYFATLARNAREFNFAATPLLWDTILIWGPVSYSPIWLPLVFLGYAAGRRAISLKFVVAFAIAEALAVAAVFFAFWYVYRS